MGAATCRCTEYGYKFGNCLFVILNSFLVHLCIRFKVPLKLAVSFCCRKTVSGIVNKFCNPSVHNVKVTVRSQSILLIYYVDSSKFVHLKSKENIFA